MGDPFDAIGFQVYDEASYQQLAEDAHRLGKSSTLTRKGITWHGYCWQLGPYLEVWTVLLETPEAVFYADCRPAFKSQRLYQLLSWEIIEYDDDGEALVTAQVGNMDLVFELQNLTELPPFVFQQYSLSASIVGLAYKLEITDDHIEDKVLSLDSPDDDSNYIENDYLVQGSIISWRVIHNPVTFAELIWLEVQTGSLILELVVNSKQCKGELNIGSHFTAEVWLQGHIISQRERLSSYEGIDYSFPPGELWSALRREN